MTLPIIRFRAHWPTHQADPLVQHQLRLVSHPASTEMGMARVGHPFNPKWVNEAQPPGSSTSPRSVEHNITLWRACQGHQKEHSSGHVPSEWESCECAWATERDTVQNGKDARGQLQVGSTECYTYSTQNTTVKYGTLDVWRPDGFHCLAYSQHEEHYVKPLSINSLWLYIRRKPINIKSNIDFPS